MHFESFVRPQADLRIEADNLDMFNNNFPYRRTGKGLRVIFPEVLRPYVTKDLLVESLEDGVPLQAVLGKAKQPHRQLQSKSLGKRWNFNEVENLQEAFVVKQLCETQTWSEFLWACSAHSSKKRAWAKTAQALDLAPPKLFQTNREDHPQAAANKAHTPELERHFVGDAECVADIQSLGGSALLARYESFQQPAHRADMWRYIRLWKEGGSYLDIKMALLQPWSTTLEEIYAEGERCLEGQRVAQSSGQRVAPPTEVRDLSQVPHLLLSIGQNRKHIFQGNMWHASAKHPLLARAVGHALGTSQRWNFCRTLGPIYLFQEQMDGQRKAERDRRGRTCLGEEFPVDGHFMFTTSGTRYAATRAWGWKKGFLPVALGAIATQRAEAQSVAQPEPQPGTPAPEAPSAPPPEAPSSSAAPSAEAQQRVAQLQETPSAATQPAANQGEAPPLETTITPEGLERIMAVATGQSWHEGLTRAEVEIFTVQGLREEIGQAMAVVEQTMEKVGVRAEQDARDRVVAAAAALPAAPPEPTLLDAALCATGEIADFFRRLTGILGPSISGNRPMLATALKDAHALPSVLQNVVRQRSAQGATWNDLTRSENVEWAAHDGSEGDPPYALAMCKGGFYEYVDRASLYSTILARLVVDAVEETANSLDAAGRQAVLERICVQFNEAARQQGQPSRLLIALGGARALKFDLDPTNIERQYGGAKKRVTKRQAESGVAVGVGGLRSPTVRGAENARASREGKAAGVECVTVEVDTCEQSVASIVSGGSIAKPGKKDGRNILDQFMQWVLDGGEETHGGDVEVEVGVVPARDSVRGAGVARPACGVPELSKSILEIVPGAYGEAKKALHFLPACASESMERVVEAARAELEVRRAERVGGLRSPTVRGAENARASREGKAAGVECVTAEVETCEQSAADEERGEQRVTARKLEEIHRLRARTEVNFSGHVLAADETVQKRDTFVRGACTQREVAGFIAADASCLVQVALWGEVAQKYFESLTKALNEAEDGVFPRIEVTACQVATLKHPEGTSLRRLASTARTTVKLLEPTPLTISPSPRVLTTSAADLMHVPQVSCFMGVVSRLEARVFSQEDVGMREIGISMQNGYEVPVMLYGVQSEEEVELKDRVAVWFGEGKPPLANRDDSKGMIWLWGKPRKATKADVRSDGASRSEELPVGRFFCATDGEQSAAPPEPTLLDATLRASGEIADFFRRLTAVLAPSIAGNRRMLATALKNAHALPRVLQNVVRQRSAWGATWNDLTRPENVEWAVRDGTMRAPAYALAMRKGHSWEYVDKATVYSTILVRLVMDVVEETADALDDVSSRQRPGGGEHATEGGELATEHSRRASLGRCLRRRQSNTRSPLASVARAVSDGGRRCKGHRRQKAGRRLRAALQICGWIWLLVCGCRGSSLTAVGYQAARLGNARGESARGRHRRKPRTAKGKVVRQSEIGAYFLLAPGQGGCLFYTVSTEVSGGPKWKLSCALGCRSAEQLDVVCCVDLCGYGFRLQTRRDVRKGCPQAQTAPRWYLPRKVRNREQRAVNGNAEAAD
ncbi:unnamed protein product [Durusdinium trenchii]|uniref:Uncharacterized protein n=1 Tax=Durusdinium trenchii TaxID=1381693 RepID=A0ABP0RS63_9DINO